EEHEPKNHKAPNCPDLEPVHYQESEGKQTHNDTNAHPKNKKQYKSKSHHLKPVLNLPHKAITEDQLPKLKRTLSQQQLNKNNLNI
ncbi:hypothetical protein RA272_29130, partial [Pseudomonas syringae pv. tagetis]